jgi:trk system potassium uptake protein TrkA
MKRYVIVGLGIFGATCAKALHEAGQEVLAIDTDPRAVDRMVRDVTRAVVGDARDVGTLERLGAKQADAAVVSTGDDISASVLAVLALQDLKVDQICVKVISQDHARVMNKLGASQTIFPEHDSAKNMANLIIHSRSLLNYIRLGENFGLQEMAVPSSWDGKTLSDLKIRQRYNVSVVALHDVLTDQLAPVGDSATALKVSDTLLVAGLDEDLARLATLK